MDCHSLEQQVAAALVDLFNRLTGPFVIRAQCVCRDSDTAWCDEQHVQRHTQCKGL